MSFLKKLFGIGEEKDKEVKDDISTNDNAENTSEDSLTSDDEDSVEVVIHDTDHDETFELICEPEENNLDVSDEKERSIKDIVEDFEEISEKDKEKPLEEPKDNVSISNKDNDVNEDTQACEKKSLDKDKEASTKKEKSIEEIINDVEEISENDSNDDTEKTIKPSEEIGIFDILNPDEVEDIEIYQNEETTIIDFDENISDESYDEEDNEENNNDEDLENEKIGFFAKLKDGIKKTRESIFDNINSVFNMFTTVDEELFEELEEALILADMGVDTSLQIINELRSRVKKKGITEVSEVKETLIDVISEILSKEDEELVISSPTVILVIGVNGAGKTTTIGKLAHNYINEGKSVTLAAADTFRAAAIDQLEIWADRTGANFIRKEEGSDPASVVYDACQSAKAKKTDVLIVDTAGRLQNKKNLMNELSKIYQIISREFENANREVFLVLDSTTGQNAMQQAILFNETADITGLILTKLDGTAKGGVIVSIKNMLNIPVRYVGLGEKIDDLEEFDSKAFAQAMFQ